jgi:hypothetical protein
VPSSHTPALGNSAPPSARQSQPAPKTRSRSKLRSARLSAAEQRRVIATISLFVRTAVARNNPGRSWPIIDPTLREGLTEREWSTGNIPVVPYPAVGFDLMRLESYVGNTALVEVILVPSRKAHLVRKTFQIELRRRLRPPHAWDVSSWVPEGVSESQIEVNTPSSPKVVAEAAHPTHLSAMWIYVPLGALLAAVILVPAFVLTRDARRFRRASRAR